MHENEQLWKSQKEESMHITTKEVCALARKYERENRVAYLAAWGVTVALIGGFVYDLIDLRNPWVIAGLAWTAATFLYMVWKLLRNGRNRMTPEEPCVVFLRRELEGKRRGLLRIRLGILLLFPGILSAWWGGGPLLRAKSLGVQSPWLRHSLAGPALLIAITPILAFCWFSFWTQTRKVEREIERLRAA